MKNEKDLVCDGLLAIVNGNTKHLEKLLHPKTTFEFPYAVPGRPMLVKGREQVVEVLSTRKFTSILLDEISIESNGIGSWTAEIHSKETYPHSNKTYEQHLICKAEISNGLITHYKEFFNPILRLNGLLELDDFELPLSRKSTHR